MIGWITIGGYVALGGAIGVLIGAVTSPLSKIYRESAKFWQGQANFFKKQVMDLQNELAETSNAPLDLSNLIELVPKQYRPLVQPILTQLQNNPELINQLIAKFLGNPNNQEKLKDVSTWGT